VPEVGYAILNEIAKLLLDTATISVTPDTFAKDLHVAERPPEGWPLIMREDDRCVDDFAMYQPQRSQIVLQTMPHDDRVRTDECACGGPHRGQVHDSSIELARVDSRKPSIDV